MTLTAPLPLAFGRFKRLPQRAGEVWQGGLVRLPVWIDHPTDADGAPSRPTGALWVSLRTGLIHLTLPPNGSAASPELALTAFLEFGLKWSKGSRGDRLESRCAMPRFETRLRIRLPNCPHPSWLSTTCRLCARS